MKKLFISLLTLLTGLSFSQELEKSLLWKISGNGLKQDSFLYGTIHITCDASLDKNTLNALEKTEQLCLELDMDDKSMQMQMMKHMMMKDGVKLSALLNEEDFKVVDAFLKKNLNMSAKMFDGFKPFIVTTMLYPKMLDCSFQSVESELMKISNEQKEEVFGLETVEDQMEVFDNISYEIQAAELVKMAKSDLQKDKDELSKMMKIYQSKDIEGMLKMMDDSDNKITSDNQDVLLTNRNKNWISKMSEIMMQKPTFFGVGAAHLAGEEGVIKLLRKKGYKVEAVQ
ncbi:MULTISPECIES: TraB/GumN family protein [unclassified Flavobacterium]|uniref:TraB/GumN family protein n=1 Tax=unclassified Flavobacterium TaxID=196869 RepID=UPI001292AB89|nr:MULTISPECIES: TraB/GumN family protein [unclassified Flavobacterium]MQP53538.1 TraB/GumN family protein [Flavobacterium sp. LMO9]MQP63513.1 TraB/GumN family protein [Flavobacterium sp. LMO6]